MLKQRVEVAMIHIIDYLREHIKEMKKNYGFIYGDRNNEGNGTLKRFL